MYTTTTLASIHSWLTTRGQGMTTIYVQPSMTAEDLEGSDNKYVQWAEEHHLMQRLAEKLAHLQEVESGDTGAFQRG